LCTAWNARITVEIPDRPQQPHKCAANPEHWKCPSLRDHFHFAPLDSGHVFLAAALGFVSIAWFELFKLVRIRRFAWRRKHQHKEHSSALNNGPRFFACPFSNP
jgi:hypothetical protein